MFIFLFYSESKYRAKILIKVLLVTYKGFCLQRGMSISFFMIIFSCLLPLQIGAKESVSVKQQLESGLTQLLIKEIAQWQQQADLKSVQHTIKVRVPSGAVKLKPCLEPLKIDGGTGLVFGNVQRKVSCGKPNWSLFVRAKVEVTAKLPVANRAMKRGEFVRAQDIEWQQIVLGASDRDVMTRSDDITGRQVRRKIRRYKAIELHHLSPPQWVNIGDKVIIEARSQGVYVKMAGEALESGGEGEAIRVKNLSSGKVITAFPTAKGRVMTVF